MTCHINTAGVTSAIHGKHAYAFDATCGHWNPPSQTACPPPVKLKGTGEWDPATGTAHERFTRAVAGTEQLASETTSSCPYDPWLKGNNQCKVLSGTQVVGHRNPILYPRSASLSAAQRQALAAEVAKREKISQQMTPSAAVTSAQMKAAIPLPAPELLSPPEGQGYIKPKTLYVEVKHTPEQKAECKTYWKTPQAAGQGTLEQTVKMDYNSDMKRSAGPFTLSKAGVWTVVCEVKNPPDRNPASYAPLTRTIKAYDDSRQQQAEQQKSPLKDPSRNIFKK